MRSGETLGSIARRYHVSQRQIQSWNSMGKGTRIRSGQRLRVSTSESAPRAGKKVGAYGDDADDGHRPTRAATWSEGAIR